CLRGALRIVTAGRKPAKENKSDPAQRTSVSSSARNTPHQRRYVSRFQMPDKNTNKRSCLAAGNDVHVPDDDRPVLSLLTSHWLSMVGALLTTVAGCTGDSHFPATSAI